MNVFSNIIHLDTFNLRSLSIKQADGDPGEKTEYAITFGYAVEKNDGAPDRFRLTLVVDLAPKGKEAPGAITVSASVVGLFSFPKGVKEEDMQYVLQVNGSAILYGLLRGQVAMLTGAFRGPRFLLPTVNMAEIVKEVEAKAKANQEPAATRPSPTLDLSKED